MEIPLSYDNSWQKALQVIARQGIVISSKHKDTGTIRGSKSIDRSPMYFACPALKGEATSYSYDISFTILEKDESSSIVLAQANGSRRSYQNRYFCLVRKIRG